MGWRYGPTRSRCPGQLVAVLETKRAFYEDTARQVTKSKVKLVCARMHDLRALTCRVSDNRNSSHQGDDSQGEDSDRFLRRSLPLAREHAGHTCRQNHCDLINCPTGRVAQPA